MQARNDDMDTGEIMTRFARATGLSPQHPHPRRYLWTDAFAVCNFIELRRRTGEPAYLSLAEDLVHQVHRTLGYHREDDPRSGPISGLDATAASRHPTAGGLRIGKKLGERKPDQSFDMHLEWDRDGQYYHYLTKWMHALHQMAEATDDPVFAGWACELAKAAQRGFVHAQAGYKRMYWKMSIDLSHPLVASMGQHDPIDGLVTYHELQRQSLRRFGQVTEFDLRTEIADMTNMCRHVDWTTGDPLGIGGLLFDACRTLQLALENDGFDDYGLLDALLESSRAGLAMFMAHNDLAAPAERRLAFRELGLAIGLHGVPVMQSLLERDRAVALPDAVGKHVRSLSEGAALCTEIEAFWLAPESQQAQSWRAHEDINMVMLATSLAPEGFLRLHAPREP